MTRNRLKILLLLLVIAFSWLLPGLLRAQSITKGQSSREQLVSGMLVGAGQNPNEVSAVAAGDEASLQGVVIRADALTADVNDELSASVLVAYGGSFEVLVDSSNGNIRRGDYLTVSQTTDGVAMRSDSRHKQVVGKALEAVDFAMLDSADNPSRKIIKPIDSATVVTSVLVALEVGDNPFAARTIFAPKLLTETAEKIADGPVSGLRMYSSMAVLVATSVLVVRVFLISTPPQKPTKNRGKTKKSTQKLPPNTLHAVGISIIVVLTGLSAIYLILAL